jgi:hypothetical protein
MDDKKLESQKTVVAFVAGLLIGGLLVWVFSASPDKPTPSTSSEETPEGEVTETVEVPETSEETQTSERPTSSAPIVQEEINGNFSFSVADQAAGTSVALGTIAYPTTEGWIVVHEDVNGSLGNALGAARFNTAAGLNPQSVSLLRATTAGKDYHVVFYSENGDRMFDIREDAVMMKDGTMLSSMFTAN